jgi:kynurenine formamidase
MPVYPGDAEVEVTRVSEWRSGGCNLTTFAMSAHAGTHIDAPFHFVDQGTTVDGLSLDVLVGPAEVLDVGLLAPDSDITAAMLEPFAGRVTKGSRVLLRTGWSTRFGAPEFFTKHPGLTSDAAQWLVDRHVALLGLEEPSVNTRLNAEVHAIILGAGIALLENLTNLDRLPERVFLVALPINLAGCDGAPVRAVALLDRAV